MIGCYNNNYTSHRIEILWIQLYELLMGVEEIVGDDNHHTPLLSHSSSSTSASYAHTLEQQPHKKGKPHLPLFSICSTFIGFFKYWCDGLSFVSMPDFFSSCTSAWSYLELYLDLEILCLSSISWCFMIACLTGGV